MHVFIKQHAYILACTLCIMSINKNSDIDKLMYTKIIKRTF